MHSSCQFFYTKPAVSARDINNHLNKEDFVRFVYRPQNVDYLENRPSYCLCRKTLVLFDFYRQPLFGFYRSAAVEIDQQGLHFILIRCSIATIIDRYSRFHLDGNLAYQKDLADKAGFNSYHSILKGHVAFFSIKGMTQPGNDWVSLHQVEHSYISKGQLHFTQGQLKISFSCKQEGRLYQYLAAVLKLNRLILDFMINEGYSSWGGLKKSCILLNQDYYGHLLDDNLQIAQTRRDFENDKQKKLIKLVTGLLDPDDSQWLLDYLDDLIKEFRRRHFN